LMPSLRFFILLPSFWVNRLDTTGISQIGVRVKIEAENEAENFRRVRSFFRHRLDPLR
jgi:hypothetical protein